VEISEIRVKLLVGQRDKLRAFASLTIDKCLVVRDIKIIEGPSGLFVAMPSRKLMDRCPQCGGKNPLRASYCSECASPLEGKREERDVRGKPRLYADIAHPIHQAARDFVQGAILAAYRAELDRSQEEGYVAHDFDDLDYEAYEEGDSGASPGGVRGPLPSVKQGAGPDGKSETNPDAKPGAKSGR
jgi:stage V sporulation protein G